MHSELAKRRKITEQTVLSEVLQFLADFNTIFHQFVQEAPPIKLPRPA
jgi:hypothetical protein